MGTETLMDKDKGQCTVMGGLFFSCHTLRIARCAWYCRRMLGASFVFSCGVLWYDRLMHSLLILYTVLLFSCGVLCVSCLVLYSLMLYGSVRCEWVQCLSPLRFLPVLLPLPVHRAIQSEFSGCFSVVATIRFTLSCRRNGVGVVWFECSLCTISAATMSATAKHRARKQY